MKKYWKEGLFFSGITVYYIVGIAPDMTWLSQGGDAFDYVIGATRMWAVRPTGYPSYILIGWLFERLPFNPFWNLGLLSALSSVATCIFIFLTIKLFVGQKEEERSLTLASSFSLSSLPLRWAPYIGAATYAGAFLVWAQSTIPEVYTLTTLLMVMATYFALKGRWYVTAVVLAVGVGTHHLIVFAIVPLLGYLWYQRRKKLTTARYPVCLGIGVLGLLPYLQTQLAVHGQETAAGLSRVWAQSLGSIGFVGTLPLSYTWIRLTEFVPGLLTAVGVGLVLLAYLQWRRKEIILLGILAILPIGYYFTAFIPMWIVYMVPGIAFLSILIGIGVSRFPYRKVLPVFLIVPIILMGMNIAYYDLGRSVDPSPSTARQFYNQLDTIEDGSIFYIHTWGEPWLVTYYYTVENDNRFNLIFQSELLYHGNEYSHYLEGLGVRMPEPAGYDMVSGKPDSKYFIEDAGFFENWNTETYLKDLKELNPDKKIYVSVAQGWGDRYDKLRFGLKEVTP